VVEQADTKPKAFRKLLVWQRAHKLVLLIYKLTEPFPKQEMFGLTSQIRRAAVSVPANISEGYAAGSKGQFARYLNIAQGSLAEVEYYLMLSRDLHFINDIQCQEVETLRGEAGFLLHQFIKSLKK